MPIQQKTHQTYRLEEVNWLTHNVLRLVLIPTEGKVFAFKPGQFSMLRLTDEQGKPWRQMAYSMASSPLTTGAIELGVKVFGEFTQRVAKLNVDDVVELLGPYGAFLLDEKAPRVAFLAGGIGITPFMSMMRYAAGKKLSQEQLLFYCNRTQDDIAYHKDIEELKADNPHLTVVHVLEESDASWQGEKGRMTTDLLKKHCTHPAETMFYTCGPQPMMDAVFTQLAELGVPQDHVKHEKF